MGGGSYLLPPPPWLRYWLGIKESLDRIAKASSMRWYGVVLRKEDKNGIVKALKFEVSGSRGTGRPKETWKKQVEIEMKKNGLVKEDACDRTKWRGVVKTRPNEIRPTSSKGTIQDPTCDDDDRKYSAYTKTQVHWINYLSINKHRIVIM